MHNIYTQCQIIRLNILCAYSAYNKTCGSCYCWSYDRSTECRRLSGSIDYNRGPQFVKWPHYWTVNKWWACLSVCTAVDVCAWKALECRPILPAIEARLQDSIAKLCLLPWKSCISSINYRKQLVSILSVACLHVGFHSKPKHIFLGKCNASFLFHAADWTCYKIMQLRKKHSHDYTHIKSRDVNSGCVYIYFVYSFVSFLKLSCLISLAYEVSFHCVSVLRVMP